MMSLLRPLALALALVLSAGAAPAASPATAARLFEALGLPRTLEIIREEGKRDAEDLMGDFALPRSRAWDAAMARLYDPAEMGRHVEASLARELTEAEAAEVAAFFGSDLGRRIVRLEVEARTAFLDPDLEAAAEDAARRLERERGPRLELLERFIEVNDLLESNVSGALTASYAFYDGMDAAGGGEFLGGDDVAGAVWDQEGRIREETRTWLLAYLALAYGPLPDSELAAYVALSESAAGQALNKALFEGFDAMFLEQSRALGRAFGREVSGQDI